MTAWLARKKPLLRFLGWFAIANTLLFYIAGLPYLRLILSAKTLFINSFFSYDHLAGKALVLLFTALAFVGHFAFLAILSLSLALFSIFLNTRKLTLSIAIICSTLSVCLLLLDYAVFSLFHFHLSLGTVMMLADQHFRIFTLLEISNTEMIEALLIFIGVLFLEIIIALLVWHKIVLRNRFGSSKKILASLLSCLACSHLIIILTIANDNNLFAQQTPTLPLYNQLLATLLPVKDGFALLERYSETRFSQPLFPDSPLHYPLHPLQFKAPKTAYNILVIGVDTWRYDAINTTLTPTISEFAKKSWYFTNHFSGGNSTQAGLFSLFYGLPASYWPAMQKQHQGALLIHRLLQQHYQTNIFFSSAMVPPFNETIFYDLKNLRLRSASGITIPDHDRAITQEWINFLDSRESTKPFFTFLLYDSAHGYCMQQNIPTLFQTNNTTCERLTGHASLQELQHRYQNAIHFIDDQVALVLKTLNDKKLLDKTIVIITGDHGEEFNDNHQHHIGHGSNYSAYQVRTPLIIYWPKQKPMRFSQQTSHYDIAPYLMQHALGCINPIADYSIGKSLTQNIELSHLLVGGYMNMGWIEKNRITTLLTAGHIEITDKKLKPILNAKPDDLILKQALMEMRKYYRRL